MSPITIEKVWAVQDFLFKDTDYSLALELEDAQHRVSLRYICITTASPAYQINDAFGWNQTDFVMFKSLELAQQNCLASA